MSRIKIWFNRVLFIIGLFLLLTGFFKKCSSQGSFLLLVGFFFFKMFLAGSFFFKMFLTRFFKIRLLHKMFLPGTCPPYFEEWMILGMNHRAFLKNKVSFPDIIDICDSWSFHATNRLFFKPKTNLCLLSSV